LGQSGPDSKKAAGFFIYASTVIKFVASKNHRPAKQLNQIISLPHSTSHEGRSGIDLLYTQILEQAVKSVYADDKELLSSFRTVVGALLLVFNPLSVEAFSDLLKMSDINTTLRSLHSLLLVPTSNIAPIYIFHKSFPDFLTDSGRCMDHRFFIDPQIHHKEILLSCLALMNKRLEKNICKLDEYVSLSDVGDLLTCRTTYIGAALEYACLFWTNHLVRIPVSGPDVKEVQKSISRFFKKHLLFWIEVLSLMRNLDAGVHALNDIQQWYVLVSYIEHMLESPISHLFLQEFPASGQMTVSASSWNTLMLFPALPPRYTILLSHFHLPHLGSTITMLQSS